jgi:phosphatidylserine/phosphatidylglycerophosphate/cardiolipin synthase-like enzyme
MAQFLTTHNLVRWIIKLIDSSKDELIIIVPYIKTSSIIYNSLFKAAKRGVEIIIVYRENQLPEDEREKLLSLPNLSLF